MMAFNFGFLDFCTLRIWFSRFASEAIPRVMAQSNPAHAGYFFSIFETVESTELSTMRTSSTIFAIPSDA